MPKQVRAFGQILSFPDDMTDDAMAKAIRDNEHLLSPDYKESSGFSGMAEGIVRGAKQTGRMVGAAIDTLTGNLSSVEKYADESATAMQRDTPVEQKALLRELSAIDREQGEMGKIGDALSAAKRNPMGTGQFIVEQTPNTAVSLGAGYAGFKTGAAAGAFVGPMGAAIGGTLGFLSGMFLGNYLLESGNKAIEKAGDEDGFTLQDRDAAIKEGAIKSGAVTVVDALTFKLGGAITKLLGRSAINAGAKAEAEVLMKAGVDMSSPATINAALKSSPELFKAARIAGERASLQSLSRTKKAGIIGTGLVAETLGEGVGEYVGEYAATGKPDVVDATMESLAGLTQSSIQAAYNFNKLKAGNDLSPEGIHKVASSINEHDIKEGVSKINTANSVDEAIAAANDVVSQKPTTKDDVLRAADPTLVDIERLTGLKPTEAIGQAIAEAQQQASGIPQKEINGSIAGTHSAPNLENSRNKAPGISDIVLPDGTTLQAQWDVVDADSVSASIKEGVNQPRDRTRVASDIQIQGIASNPDYRRLSDSPVMDVGAPVLSHDNLIVGGNGRFEGISQAYNQGTEEAYLRTLIADAESKGIDRAVIQGMKKPVLVRRITQPFDTRKLAIASNSGGGLQYSGLEIAKIDAERMSGIEDLDITDSGDIALTASNFGKLRRTLGDYNPTELAAFTDDSGSLSQDGVRRIRNAMLAKAYGKSDTLGRLVESTDADMRNVLGALTKSAGAVAKAKANIAAGAAPKEIDVTDNLLQAVETFSQIRSKGQPLDNYLAQQSLFGDGIDADSKEFLQFLHDNVRSQKRLTGFINEVYDQISAIDQSTDNIFGDNAKPTKRELIENAKQRTTEGQQQPDIFQTAGADNKAGQSNEQQSKTKADNVGGGKKSQQDPGLKFSRSPEERLKDRERSRQLEKLLNQKYNFTITPKDVRLGAAANGRGQEAATAERIARIFGKRVTWIEAKGDFPINGVMVPGIKDTIFVDVTTKEYAHAVIGHELSHHMEYDAPKAYRDMVEALMPIIKDADAYQAAKDLDDLSKENVIKEIVGDIMGDNFTDPAFWDKVAKHNPNAFRKIADTVITWLKRLVENAKIRSLGSEQWVTDAQKAQDIVARSVARYSTVSATSAFGKESSKIKSMTLDERKDYKIDAIKFSRSEVIPETINIDGVDRPTRNSEGRFIHPTEDGIRSFWRWFSGSKVTDGQGRPLVVYHGSNANFTEFDNRLSRDVGAHFGTKEQAEKLGKNVKEFYLKANVNEVYVTDIFSDRNQKFSDIAWELYQEDLITVDQRNQLDNIFDTQAYRDLRERATYEFDRSDDGSSEKFWQKHKKETIKFWRKATKYIKDNGYNGIRYENNFEGDGESFVVFNSNQIKSATDNTGAFSEDPDIRFSRGGKLSETAQKSILSDNQPEAAVDSATTEGNSPFRTDDLGIPKETRFREFQREWQDDFNRFTVLKEWLASRGINLSEKADVFLAEERFHAKVANQKEDFRDFVVNPLIERIAKAGFKMTDIADYLEAQHAQEANAQIRRLHDTNDPEVTAYGISDEDAADYLEKAPEELGKLANEFRAITEQTKRLRLDGGLLNTDITDAWEATYRHYIPVKGLQEQQKGTGKGLSVNFKTKRRLGHGRRDEAVIENILHDHERAIFEVEKNRVAKHLAMMAAEIGMPELMTIGQPEKRQVLRNTTAYEVQVKGVTTAVFDTREAAQTYKSTLPLIDKKIASDEVVINPTTDQRIVASASPMLADNEINAYIDGHTIRIQINDEIAARAYKKLGIDGYGKLVAAGRALNGYLSKVYTGYNPEFIMVNLVRDFTTGVINLTGEEGLMMAAKAIKNYPGTFASLLQYAVSNRKKSNKWIDMYRSTGGNTGAAYLSDMERLGNDVATEYAAYQGVLANLKEGKPVFAARAAGRKVFNVFLKWIYNMNQAGENAMRLAAFKAMIESGKTKNEAAHIAKNITVNFNRKGENGATANAAWLFFNASVQGQAAMFHALFKGKHKGQSWALVSGMVTLGYLVASALGGGDEDDYDKIDDYTKERNLVMKHGDGWLKIPVPYGYGFFYNLGRSMADAQRKGELGLLPWHISASAIEELTPFGDVVVGSDEQFKMDQIFMGMLPTALKIPGQVATNKQTFSGGEIMPESPFDKSQPDREKMWRGTKGTIYDELAGYLQMAGMDVSPETLKYSFRTGTGGAGALVDTTISAGMLKAEGAELEPNEMPFLRKIYQENTIKNDRAAFHKARQEAQTAAEELARAVKRNDLITAKKLSEDKGEIIALDKYADKLQKATRMWRDEQDRVRVDKNMTAGEKRLKLKELEAQEAKLYDQFLEIFKVKKADVNNRMNEDGK